MRKKNGELENLYFGWQLFYPEAGKPQLLKKVTNKEYVLAALLYVETTYSK